MCRQSSCRCAAGDPAAAGQPVLGLDMEVVEEAVRLLAESEESRGLDGYRADFVLARQSGTAEYTTTLCEVNDGYVSGRYDDFAVADFTDMIVARFAGLQASCTRPG